MIFWALEILGISYSFLMISMIFFTNATSILFLSSLYSSSISNDLVMTTIFAWITHGLWTLIIGERFVEYLILSILGYTTNYIIRFFSLVVR